MEHPAREFLVVLAVGTVGGMAMYATQFIGAGTTPASIQVMQVTREIVSTTIFGLAAATGYLRFGRDELRREYPIVIGLFIGGGLVGYAVGFVALLLSPPEGFTIGSRLLTFSLVTLQEVVPFAVAGFAGAAVRAFRAG